MEYLVLATNALWAVMAPKDVFEFIKENSQQGLGAVSNLLAQKVKELYVLERAGGGGQPTLPDITIII